MGLKPKKLAWLTLGLLIAALWLASFGSGTAQAAGRGSLEIRLRSDEGAQYPPGDLTLSDPEARLTGAGYRPRQTYREIPNSVYTSEDIGPRQQAFALYVDDAASGTYSLRVIGVDYGKYLLTFRGTDDTGAHADLRFTGLIEPGEVHHYVINYSNRDGASLKVRRSTATE